MEAAENGFPSTSTINAINATTELHRHDLDRDEASRSCVPGRRVEGGWQAGVPACTCSGPSAQEAMQVRLPRPGVLLLCCSVLAFRCSQSFPLAAWLGWPCPAPAPPHTCQAWNPPQPQPVQHADDEFSAATYPALDGVSGAYFRRGRQPPKVAGTPSAQLRLWKLLEQQAGVPYPDH